jgi:nucleoside-diphosphate-sugar epimerase
MSKPSILITGGSGFLGRYLVQILRPEYDVFVISRSGNTEIEGDLCKWNAGVDLNKLKYKNFKAMIHLAGLYDLRASDLQCFQNNIMGTQIALKLAEDLSISLFFNASSIAAAINVPSPQVGPYDLNFHKAFPDPYAMSKACVEQALKLRERSNSISIINLRLGVLVGDTFGSKILRIDGPYHLPSVLIKLKVYLEKFLMPLPLPGAQTQKIPLVPVNSAAEAIANLLKWALSNAECKAYKSFHLTPNKPLPLKEFYECTLKYLQIKNKGVVLVDNYFTSSLNQLAHHILKFPEAELNYLNQFPLYDSGDTESILGKDWCPEFCQYEKSFWSGYEKILANC